MIKKSYLTIILILLIIFFGIFLSLNKFSGKGYFSILNKFLSNNQIQQIQKYVLPYRFISQQDEEINKLTNPYSRLELDFKNTEKDIQVAKMLNIKLSNNLILNRYNLVNGFYSGINNEFPGSAFLDFHSNNLVILSARGILGFTNNLNKELNFKQIKNNINEFIDIDQFRKHRWFSLKDLFILNNEIYISYTEEIEENCWNTSIIRGAFNYNSIQFEKFFSPKNCILSINNSEGEFNAHQSGGRIVNFDENHILLSIGDYRNRFHGQDETSINGKVIMINKNNSNYKIVSMGHRNPQGLYFDKENNFVLETEHGPQGGDEINLLYVNKFKSEAIQNFGWPIVSGGEHYGGKIDANKAKYLKYPLFKSHNEYGFIEPLKSFVPSIGISEISKINKNNYVVSSLGDRSIYLFELNNENKIINLKRIEVFERIRDLIVKDNILYLSLEDTASIGVINFK